MKKTYITPDTKFIQMHTESALMETSNFGIGSGKSGSSSLSNEDYGWDDDDDEDGWKWPK